MASWPGDTTKPPSLRGTLLGPPCREIMRRAARRLVWTSVRGTYSGAPSRGAVHEAALDAFEAVAMHGVPYDPPGGQSRTGTPCGTCGR